MYLSTKVWKVHMWMGQFQSRTPKRSTLWSNTRFIAGFWSSKKLDMSSFKKAKKGNKKFRPVRSWKDKRGRTRWQGTKHLRETGLLTCNCLGGKCSGLTLTGFLAMSKDLHSAVCHACPPAGLHKSLYGGCKEFSRPPSQIA